MMLRSNNFKIVKSKQLASELLIINRMQIIFLLIFITVIKVANQ